MDELQTADPAVVPAPPCTLVIFGARGDLTKRLLMPQLYNLDAGHLSDGLRVIGIVTTTTRTKAGAGPSPTRCRAWAWKEAPVEDYAAGSDGPAA